jgi:hypothetical protein
MAVETLRLTFVPRGVFVEGHQVTSQNQDDGTHWEGQEDSEEAKPATKKNQGKNDQDWV